MAINQLVYSKRFLFGHKGFMLCAPFPGLWSIRIHPDLKDDVGIHVHEEDGHLADYRAHPWTYMWKMVFNAKYRLNRETHYYAKQYLQYPSPGLLEHFAGFIAENYWLPITAPAALDLLQAEVARLQATGYRPRSVSP